MSKASEWLAYRAAQPQLDFTSSDGSRIKVVLESGGGLTFSQQTTGRMYPNNMLFFMPEDIPHILKWIEETFNDEVVTNTGGMR